MKLAAGFVLNQDFSRVVFYFTFMDHFDGLCLKKHRRGNGRPLNQMERENSPGLRLC